MSRRKGSLEVLGTGRQREGRLLPEPASAREPLDLVLLQEAIAPVLSLRVFLSQSKSLHQRQILLSDRLESCHVELPDFRSRDLKDTGQLPVGRISRASGVRHEAAPLQFDDSIYLLFGKLLHIVNMHY